MISEISRSSFSFHPNSFFIRSYDSRTEPSSLKISTMFVFECTTTSLGWWYILIGLPLSISIFMVSKRHHHISTICNFSKLKYNPDCIKQNFKRICSSLPGVRYATRTCDDINEHVWPCRCRIAFAFCIGCRLWSWWLVTGYW